MPVHLTDDIPIPRPVILGDETGDQLADRLYGAGWVLLTDGERAAIRKMAKVAALQRKVVG